MKIRSLFFIALALVLCLALVGCNGGIKKKDAKGTAEAFVAAIEDGDFEDARALLHPDSPFDVEKYFNGIEERKGVDFQKGIEIKRFEEYSYSHYESEVGGSEYELELRLLVDGKSFELSLDIVKNEGGYGIYDIELDQEP